MDTNTILIVVCIGLGLLGFIGSRLGKFSKDCDADMERITREYNEGKGA